MGDCCRVQMKKNKRASRDVVLWERGLFFIYYFSIFDTCPFFIRYLIDHQQMFFTPLVLMNYVFRGYIVIKYLIGQSVSL